jgi:glycosyltransferase involved in cell wall biosynthesis
MSTEATVSARAVRPRISVLMPSLNQSRFIEQAILSVLDQCYPDTELIVIDGGSTDGTVEILRRYAGRIVKWVSEPDDGMSAALNKGFRLANGDLIGWQNTDDYYGPGSFLSCARAAAAAPGDDLFHGRTWLVDEEGRQIKEIPSGEFSLLDRAENFPLVDLPNQALFIRRSAFGEMLFADESYRCGMDGELVSRLLLSGSKTRFVPGITGFYRVHAGAKTFQEGSRSSVEACRLCAATLERCDLSPQLRDRIVTAFHKMLIALFRTGDSRRFREYARMYRTHARRQGRAWDVDLAARCGISLAGDKVMRRLLAPGSSRKSRQ